MQSTLPAKPRIEIVDALRGFALLGIIIAHMNNQYYAGFPPPGHNFTIKHTGDQVLEMIAAIFIVGKFFTIFSFLFGLSFGIQMLNAQEKGKPFLGRFAWRLLILFAIGFLHHMNYRGDILTIYAVLGFFLLLFYKANKTWLLIWAFFFLLNGPGFIFQCVNYIQSLNATAQPGPDFAQMEKDATVYFNHVKAGDYFWLIKTNITKEYNNKLMFQLFSGRLFITMGLFLLGLYAARKRVFENLAEYRRGFKKWLWISLAISILCVVTYGLSQDVFNGPPSLRGLFTGFLVGWFDPALSMVYVALLIILSKKPAVERRLSALVPLGRMGLTTYLLQSVFGLLLFYGYGLNKLDVIGNSIAFAAGLAFFIVQIYFSKWWMKRYHYGPFEWLWRSATYFKKQPFKKSQ